ncbi:D-Ala-D-Ala carboxypeptidase family metallohydrolase [Syntrophotalea acetylenica]|jgi:uncharacterized protein YcbK (DUF882 family)|uniref:D-Ala-D-Ala carboxypeptidase family metallohydrolase n=1 Tax=Syntrophotalea acetylenica TaxID=29542 RepID=UPI002A36E3FB|nr:D-Ala-D-Ala carboxypeptidase family metallohydrolase [Syntrophotalea acetylenica]MDY0261996.1 D-Ala-D-Ala carboxypeptidase family metallohydrolase [Syntrophotalea acetylenica]
MGDLSTNFSRREFACHCGCGADDISPRLVAILQQMREALGAPLIITSGVRCLEHNARVGSKSNSAHVAGLAVDIECTGSRLRHALVALAVQAGINRIGIGRRFVHLDISETLPQQVLWLY